MHNECVGQNLPLVCREAKASEEGCLAAAFRVVECEEVINDFALLGKGVDGVWEIHRSPCKESRLQKRVAKWPNDLKLILFAFRSASRWANRGT